MEESILELFLILLFLGQPDLIPRNKEHIHFDHYREKAVTSYYAVIKENEINIYRFENPRYPRALLSAGEISTSSKRFYTVDPFSGEYPVTSRVLLEGKSRKITEKEYESKSNVVPISASMTSHAGPILSSDFVYSYRGAIWRRTYSASAIYFRHQESGELFVMHYEGEPIDKDFLSAVKTTAEAKQKTHNQPEQATP